MAINNTRELDIVVYGATGFVGRLVAEYLAAHAPADTRIGLAGRSAERLEGTREGLGAAAIDWPIIVADAADVAALGRLANQTKVVATTVGPYAKYGLPLAQACAAAGTHYADLTGEVTFVRACADACNATAARTGARIVNSCGFDSIPSDLGVLATFEAAAEADLGTLTDTTLVMLDMKGGFSGGTIDSMRNQVDRAKSDRKIRRLLVDPFALSPNRALEPEMSRDNPHNDSMGIRHDARINMWTGPFVMASYNTRIVRRSNALLDWAYGPDFRYSEVTGFGNSAVAPVKAAATAAGLSAVFAGMAFGPTRLVLDRLLPDPGEGPSEQARKAGYFTGQVFANTTSGAKIATTVAAQGDPGYAATSVMLGESALALALDDDLPDRAGVLTPATALGQPLIARLQAAGFTIEPETTAAI